MGLDNVLAVVGRLLYIRYCQCGLGVIVVQGVVDGRSIIIFIMT